MVGLKWLCVFGVTAVMLGGCKPGGVAGCKESDRACLVEAMKVHAVKSVETWRAELEKPVPQRVDVASQGLIDYMTMDNQANGYAQRPSIPTLEADFRADFMAAFNELPPAVLKVVGNRLLGVRFVANLGGSGYTDYVYDAQGQVAGAFMLLDSSVLQSLTANKWATWKERTPFKPEQGYTLNAQIEEGDFDTRKNAIQYILLHELGHVLSVGRKIHPNWNTPMRQQAASPDKLPFFESTWTFDVENDTYKSKFDNNFAHRKDVVYYRVGRIPGSAMGPTYASLEQTSFASLYSATTPGDDFAEAFATYVHVVMLGRPWQIVLKKDGEIIKTVKSCWEETRCAEKRRMLEELLAS